MYTVQTPSGQHNSCTVERRADGFVIQMQCSERSYFHICQFGYRCMNQFNKPMVDELVSGPIERKPVSILDVAIDASGVEIDITHRARD